MNQDYMNIGVQNVISETFPEKVLLISTSYM